MRTEVPAEGTVAQKVAAGLEVEAVTGDAFAGGRHKAGVEQVLDMQLRGARVGAGCAAVDHERNGVCSRIGVQPGRTVQVGNVGRGGGVAEIPLVRESI